MAWINKIERGLGEGDLETWLGSGGPTDPSKSPKELAAEFCEYKPEYNGQQHRSWIEMKIGMYQRATAQAEAVRSRSAVPPDTRNVGNATVVLQNIHQGSRADQHGEPAPSKQPETRAVRVAKIAEDVFHQHPKDGTAPLKKDALCERAKEEGPVPDMADSEFNEAFGQVYVTLKRRPPKSGWPLQEPYKRRLDAINRPTRS